MPRVGLLSKARLAELLLRRARGQRPMDLALAFGLEPEQISGLLYTNKTAFLTVCAEVGVDPPRPGGNVRRQVGAGTPGSKVIPCLKCREPFASEGSGDRVCAGCEKSPEWRDGQDLSAAHAEGRRRKVGLAGPIEEW